ncbi:MAG: hypothetical protein EOM26_01670 [Alphaproteobacteria bacterium]|nr:hypothetical protein [Alphaproteobacteria bacterium]
MKALLGLLAAVCVLAVPPAQAAEERISVHDIHTFVTEANSALNNPNPMVGRTFLLRNVAENAIFENNIETQAPGHPAFRDVWYRNTYYPYYYRYPYAHYPYYSTTSFEQLGKLDQIGLFENKKRLIVGYQQEYVVTGIKMRPDASMAVVDVDLKEYSTRYAPYSPYLTSGVLHGNSKCKMYLSKYNGRLFLARMDCNTVTAMPY